MTGRFWGEDDTQRACSLLASGATLAQVAVALGWSERCVRRHVRASFPYRRPAPLVRFPRHTQETWSRVELMLDDGASYREVSRTTGVSSSQIAARYPGRGWTIEITNGYNRARRTLDHSADQIALMWAEKRSMASTTSLPIA